MNGKMIEELKNLSNQLDRQHYFVYEEKGKRILFQNLDSIVFILTNCSDKSEFRVSVSDAESNEEIWKMSHK